MNRKDVIRMAREADVIDFRDDSDDPHVAQMVEFLERFADLVAAAEREECAMACEAVEEAADKLLDEKCDSHDQGCAHGASACAAAIRDRSHP